MMFGRPSKDTPLSMKPGWPLRTAGSAPANGLPAEGFVMFSHELLSRPFLAGETGYAHNSLQRRHQIIKQAIHFCSHRFIASGSIVFSIRYAAQTGVPRAARRGGEHGRVPPFLLGTAGDWRARAPPPPYRAIRAASAGMSQAGMRKGKPLRLTCPEGFLMLRASPCRSGEGSIPCTSGRSAAGR